MFISEYFINSFLFTSKVHRIAKMKKTSHKIDIGQSCDCYLFIIPA